MCPPSTLSQSGSATSAPIASSVVPETAISQAAYKHASSLLAPPILAHSIRVYLYAAALAKHSDSLYAGSAAKHDLLFVACLFHDIGTSDNYNTAVRFEIDGADAASAFLQKWEVSEQDRHSVWTAIACHTSPHIAERIAELSRLVRVGVLSDFGRPSEYAGQVLQPLKEKLEKDFPRNSIEQCLGDAVVAQAKEKPEKAPMVSWPGALLKAALENPDWDGPSDAF